MIQFFKEVYLAGFAIFFKIPWPKDIAHRAGRAVAGLTVIEWFALLGIEGHIEIFLNKKTFFPEPVVLIAFFALYLVNGYFLFFCKHGIKFAHEFDKLEKPRRVLLVVSFAVLSVAAIVFGICSAIAHRRSLGLPY
jgi:hypothetical protein